MRIFLSWSGDLSYSVAEILKEWLPSVIQTLEPFLSTESIEKGARWGTQLSAGLSSSGFGIICLSRDNLRSPWMTFEAGALSEGLSAERVCPLLIDVTPEEVTGPLAQFQRARLTRSDMLKLVATLNKSSGEQAIEGARLARLFGALWPEFERGVADSLTSHAERSAHAPQGASNNRTFRLIASRGTLVNPADQSRNISFKVETVNLLLGSLAASLQRDYGTDTTQTIFEEAGYQAALTFGERIQEKWGLEYPDDTMKDRVDRWCAFDSDVGWGKFINELTFDEATESISGAIKVLDNFQTYKRFGGNFPDCYLMHGYVRGVLEVLHQGTPLSVECDPAHCPLLHRRKTDCVFVVNSKDET